MNQKLKLILPAVGIFVFLVVGVIIFNSQKNTPEIATKPSTSITKNSIVTTSAVIGDEQIDESINTVLNEVLAENDLDAELDDIELALSEEDELNQINNLFNDNEL